MVETGIARGYCARGSLTTGVPRLQVDRLAPLDRLTVFTTNSRYDLIVLCPSSAAVLVRGGALSPQLIAGRVVGTPVDGGDLIPHGICVGSSVVFATEDGEGIVTSCVRAIEHTHPSVGASDDGCAPGSALPF